MTSIRWLKADSGRAHRAACIALPAVVGGLYLFLVRAYVLAVIFPFGLFAEILAVLYLSLVVSEFQRHQLVAALLTSLVLLSFYTACLAKWLLLHESVRFWDVSSLGEVLAILPRSGVAALAGGVGLVTCVFLINLKKPRAARASAVLAPLAGYLVCVIVVPGAVASVLETIRPDVHSRSDLNTWRNGPVYSMAREVPQAIRARQLLAAASPSAGAGAIRPGAFSVARERSRNVHVILMESFIDPLNFRDVQLPFDPIDPRLRRWMNDGNALALSGTFGGQSARAEFEVLCGVPAYEMAGLDFNVLGGAAMQCLPNLLRQRGYATVASVPVPPSFFNAGRAYSGAGFDHSHFANDFVWSDVDGQNLSDLALFEQNLHFIGPVMAQGKPIFNYVVTVAGHIPFDLNPVRRPAIVPGDTWASKTANAVHYNSAAVADFVEILEARDPHAIIVIVGDHLPTLGANDEGYRAGGYRLRRGGRASPGFWERDGSELESRATLLVIRKDRQSVSVGIIPHFVIPEVILDLLSDGTYCQKSDCISKQPVLYRPNGTTAVFAAPDSFPQPACDGEQRERGGRCETALRLHVTMQAAYRSLLHDGLGRVQLAVRE